LKVLDFLDDSIDLWTWL